MIMVVVKLKPIQIIMALVRALLVNNRDVGTLLINFLARVEQNKKNNYSTVSHSIGVCVD